jgi:hypothetical protein
MMRLGHYRARAEGDRRRTWLWNGKQLMGFKPTTSGIVDLLLFAFEGKKALLAPLG